ncbi:MAG: hypothetical protein FWG87_13600 [Defluviitaleaceae bacterium]|nr:hypothetical protein [Defluviitaleaceae bacterium]
MVFLDNTARRPTQSVVTSGRINPSPTKTVRGLARGKIYENPMRPIKSA